MLFIIEAILSGVDYLGHVTDILISDNSNFQQGLLLLLLHISTNNELNKEMTIKFFEDNPKLKEIPPIQSVIEFICEDNFKDETYSSLSNVNYWHKLSTLKGEMVEYYTQNVCESQNENLFCEFHSKFYQMTIQLKRLRMVIQPEFHVIKNIHPVSKIPYFSVRGFWLDMNDKKVKIFTKSLGREDKYVDGKNDKILLEEATRQIQQLAFDKYKEEYK